MNSISLFTDEENDAGVLLKTLPHIRRARGWRLYTDQTKLVDLWQGGGTALLGHKPAQSVKLIKNIAERGLFTALPSIYEHRLKKALAALFPEKDFRVFRDTASLQNALEQSTLDFSTAPAIWRPFSGEKAAQIEALPLFVPVLPFPLAPKIVILDINYAEKLKTSDLVPPFIIAATAQAAVNLYTARGRGSLPYRKIRQALQKKTNWRQEGIYLFYTAEGRETREGSDWKQLFSTFLDQGFVLPPSSNLPLILPGELSAAEETQLAALLGDSRL